MTGRRATRGGRWARARVLLLLVLVVTSGLVGASSAQAHAYLLGSNPTDGAVLETAPSTLVLDFSESVIVGAMAVDLATSTGTPVTTGAPSLSTAEGAGSTEEPVHVVVPLPALERGAYRLAWSTVSADDLHRTSGVLVFGVGTAVAAAGWTESSPSPFEALLQAIILAAVAVGVATPVAARVWRQGAGSRDGIEPELARTGALVGLAGAVAGLALLVSQLLGSSQAVASILQSRYAAWWSLRELGLVLLVVASLSGRRTSRMLGVAGAVLAAVTTSLLGHSGSGESGSVLRTLVSVVHVLSTGCWLGTLALLLLVVLRRRPPAGRVRSVLVAFGPVAGVSVGLTAATGLALASGVVGSLDALLLTDYGRLLMVKVVLVGGLLVAGLVTHRRLRRVGADRDPRPLGRLVVAEGIGGVVVLLLTGLVTTGQPATEHQLTTDPRLPGSVSASQRVGDLQEEVAVRPNLPGQNVAVVRVADSRRPSPGPVAGVTVVVVDSAGKATTAPATLTADGVWSAPLTLREWGPVTLRTVVERHGLPAVTGELAWRVAAPSGTPQTVVSREPLAPVLTGAAWVVLAGLVIGAVVALRRWSAAQARPSRKAGPREPRPGPHDDEEGPTPEPVPVGAVRRRP